MTTPDDPLLLERQLCFPLYAAARRVTALYQPFLKPLGLTYTQYLVMLVLWEYGEQRVGDICRRLCLDSGTLTPVLKHMEQAGLLQRTRSGQDERVVYVALTPEGSDLREQAMAIPARIGACVPLSPEEALTLWQLLHKILQATDL